MSGPKIPAELLAQAERVFGDKEAAREWFDRPDANLLLPTAGPVDEIEAGGEAIEEQEACRGRSVTIPLMSVPWPTADKGRLK